MKCDNCGGSRFQLLTPLGYLQEDGKGGFVEIDPPYYEIMCKDCMFVDIIPK
jgi:hypothetical protein